MRNLGIFVLFLLLVQSASAVPGDVRQLEFSSVQKGELFSPFSEEEFNHFSIQEVTVTELEVADEDSLNVIGLQSEARSLNKSFADDLGTLITSLGDLIALGTQIWDIIRENRAVANVNMVSPISVLPSDIGADGANFTRMSNWSAPAISRYRVDYKNFWGMSVVSFVYTVHFQHSGQYEGTGNYLTGLRVTASNIQVAWGFEFDASSELISITNRGSEENPVGAATVEVRYRSSSVFNIVESAENFHVTGEGEVFKY